MDAYGFCLALGALGLTVMGLRAVTGTHSHDSHGHDAGHGHGGHGGHGHGHGGGHHGHLPHVGHHGHDTHGPAHPSDHHHGSKDGGKSAWNWASPRVWFSILVGAGAAGLIAKGFLFEPLVAAIAVAGGLAFERLLVGPLWNFLLRFESRPALTLESTLYEEARAETDFDAAGQGLVAVELDGQIVQLLGRLVGGPPSSRIRRGARLRIEEVDAGRNRCVVSLIGSSGSGESS